jgi:FCP1-like phosphatase family protein
MKKSGICEHSILFYTICVNCGEVLDKPYENRLDPDETTLTVSFEEIRRRNLNLEKELIREKKLALVIDLDKTLIDTTTVFSLEDADNLIALDKHAKRSDFVVFQLDDTIFVVRLRNNVRAFLHEISPFFRLQIYTGSQANYARRILKEIDPDASLFGNRIWSITKEEKKRYQLENKYEKNIKNLFPVSDRLVLVLDDTPSVWYTDEGNTIFKGLIQIKPYHYFIQPGLIAPATIAQESLHDNTLMQMKSVLLSVHELFYATFNESESHVLISLAEEKAAVFDRLHFLFVGCWEDGDTHSKEFYTLKAEEFGANVLDSFAPYITHIIVGGKGPDEQCVQALNYNGIYIVSYYWFEQSYLLFAREDEEQYALQGYPQPTCGMLSRDEPPNIIVYDFDVSDFDQLLESDDEKDSIPSIIALEDIKKDAGLLDTFMIFESDDLSSEEGQALEQGIY